MTWSPSYGALATDGWTKASRSDPNGGCFEVKRWFTGWLLRDSKQNGAGPVIWMTDARWTALTTWFRSIAAGDLREVTFAIDDVVAVVVEADSSTTVAGPDAHQPQDQVILHFTPIELTCFLDGLTKNEFDRLDRPPLIVAEAV